MRNQSLKQDFTHVFNYAQMSKTGNGSANQLQENFILQCQKQEIFKKQRLESNVALPHFSHC